MIFSLVTSIAQTSVAADYPNEVCAQLDPSKMKTGTVSWFNPAIGQGVIAVDDGPNVYVNLGIKKSAQILFMDQRVKLFVIKKGNKLQAICVRPLAL